MAYIIWVCSNGSIVACGVYVCCAVRAISSDGISVVCGVYVWCMVRASVMYVHMASLGVSVDV